MKTKVLLIICSICVAGWDPVEAQAPLGPAPSQLEVIATNGAGVEKHLVSQNGRVPLLMVRPHQAVPITLQFSSDKAGQLVAAMPLDGGQVIGGNLVVLPTGKVVFVFKPAPAFGRYRLIVQTPVEQYLLEFYVVDPNNPPGRKRQP
jgi:hypothetical protein